MVFLKHPIRITLIFFAIIILATKPFAAEYQVNPYWFRIIGGRPNRDVIVLERSSEKRYPSYYSKISIPVIYGLHEQEIYDQLNSMFYQGITHYEQEVEIIANHVAEEISINPDELNYVIEVNFKVNYNAGGLLSLSVLFYQLVGGIQEMSFMETVNIDLTTGRVIEFNDLFASDKEKSALIEAINYQIANSSGDFYVRQIDESYLDLIQSFYLLNNQIVVYFDLNDLGPQSIGIPQFSLELNKLVNQLRD